MRKAPMEARLNMVTWPDEADWVRTRITWAPTIGSVNEADRSLTLFTRGGICRVVQETKPGGPAPQCPFRDLVRFGGGSGAHHLLHDRVRDVVRTDAPLQGTDGVHVHRVGPAPPDAHQHVVDNLFVVGHVERAEVKPPQQRLDSGICRLRCGVLYEQVDRHGAGEIRPLSRGQSG